MQMRLSKTLAALPLLLIGTSAGAQMMGQTRTTLLNGDFKALKGEAEVDVVFVYDGMLVGNGLTNEQYVTKKTKELNDKEAGRGDKWATNWIGDRAELYHPKFFELYNKVMDGKQKAAENNSAAKYRLIVKTVSTEPGYNIGISRVPASIGATIQLVEIANPDVVLGEVAITNVPGSNAMGFDYDTGGRIAECYAKLGKEISNWMIKKQWK